MLVLVLVVLLLVLLGEAARAAGGAGPAVLVQVLRRSKLQLCQKKQEGRVGGKAELLQVCWCCCCAVAAAGPASAAAAGSACWAPGSAEYSLLVLLVLRRSKLQLLQRKQEGRVGGKAELVQACWCWCWC